MNERSSVAPLAGDLVSEFAAAKINLYLHVIGRRPGGYHLIDSLIAFAGVGDRLSTRAADEFSLTLSGPFANELAAGADNLVLRAARALAEAAGAQRAASLTLEKNLPVASGIGGGSADAAAALHALMRLWQVRLPAETLDRLALGLGADVPVCFGRRAAVVGGIGEEIDVVPALPAAGLVLVNPRVAVPTAAVFRALAEKSAGSYGSPAAFRAAREMPREAGALARLLRACRNDLTEPAIALAPAIGTVLSAIAATRDCLLDRLSGSGATCFGIYPGAAAAQAAALALARDHPQWWIAAAPLLADANCV